MKDERLQQAILTYKLGAEISAEAMPNSESLEKEPIVRWFSGWSERLNEAARSDPEFQDVRATDVGKYMPTFSYAEELLRYFRPDYDELGRREQAALIQGACGRINKFHDALEDLVAFAEYATYDAEKGKLRKLKPAMENVRRDVKAALYKHVEGLSNAEIGARLRTTLRGEGQKDKHDDSTARGWIDRGAALLRQGWGEEGWRKLIASMRSQHERWSNLSEEDRLLEATAEQIAAFRGIPVEEALRIIEFGEPDESKDGAVYILAAFNRGAEKLLEQNHQ